MLTEKEMQILQTINSYICKNSFSPSVREVMQISNFKSASTVHSYINRLKLKGYVSYIEKLPRTLKITEKALSIIKKESI